MKPKLFLLTLLLASAPLLGADEPELLLPEDVASYLSFIPDDFRVGKYPIRFNTNALASLPPQGEVQLSLPNGNTYTLVYERSVAHESGNTTWIGYLKNFGNDFRVIITSGSGGSSVGRIQTPLQEFRIESKDGISWLVDPLARGETPANMGEDIKIPPMQKRVPLTPQAEFKLAPSPQTTIDLMIVYTPGLATKYGAGLQARLDNLVAVANQAYIDSEVAITLRLVHSAQVIYSETISNNIAIDDLTFAEDGAVHPAFSGVAGLRNTYGADLVALIRPYINASHEGCGVGWIGGFEGQPISQSAEFGYSVVSEGSDGSNYCDDISLTHELGHNMGSLHDRGNSAPGLIGAYSYSFGYGISGTFGTIMAYISPRVAKFSNPNILCNGSPCGVSEFAANSANNALSLNNTRAGVAGYRAAPPPGSLSFSSASYSMPENGGNVVVSVSRSGGSAGVANVSFASANGSATSGSDYTLVSGNLTWANGESGAKTFSIPIVDDSVVESMESFTVSLNNASGASLGSPASATITISDNDVSTIPTGLTATVLSSSQISLSWNGGSAAYQLERCSGNPALCTVFYLSGTSFTDSVLLPLTTYTYRVKGIDFFGVSGVYSNPVSAATQAAPANPPPVISLTANGTTFSPPASVTLVAAARDDGSINQVEFYLGNALIGSDTVAPYSYTYGGLLAGSYVFRARAIDNLGAIANSNSVTVTVTVGADTTPPSIPGGLTATVLNSSQIALAWNPASDPSGPLSYEVERCTTGGASVCSSFLLGNASFTDRILLPLTSYRYRVRAIDRVGNRGGWSPLVTATTTS